MGAGFGLGVGGRGGCELLFFFLICVFWFLFVFFLGFFLCGLERDGEGLRTGDGGRGFPRPSFLIFEFDA